MRHTVRQFTLFIQGNFFSVKIHYLTSYNIWLHSKWIIFFRTSQIIHFLNKVPVCEKKGEMFFMSHCVLYPYWYKSPNSPVDQIYSPLLGRKIRDLITVLNFLSSGKSREATLPMHFMHGMRLLWFVCLLYNHYVLVL